ncbi:MAG: hypothetical protein KatS3mg111_2909 [Pirellulaceae bacterium]|nr:MAG: hypothetical protein KatS3mg111_2909 [Pirellulaceae bacterium]
MRWLWLVGVVGLGITGLVLNWKVAKQQESPVAMAMVEMEDGTLVPVDSQPSTGPVMAPASPESIAPDGSDEDWLTRFVLIERSGEPVSSFDLRGQPYVAGFFFTTCPSVCVRQNGRMKELQTEFAGQPVRFLSISCDPEIDTPEVLRQYAARFDADPQQWLFLTGKMDYIRRVGAEFFWLPVERRGHPERFALVDAAGQLFALYEWNDESQWNALRKDLQRMIAAGGTLPRESASVTMSPRAVAGDAAEGETESAVDGAAVE